MQPKRDVLASLMSNKKLFFGIIGGVVLIIIIMIVVSLNSGTPAPAKLAALQSRISSLAGVVEKQNRDLTSGSLRDQNANLEILLYGAAGDLKKLTEGNSAKADEKLVASASSRIKKFEEALDDAKVTNTLDSAYQTGIVAELTNVEQQITALLPEVGTGTKTALSDIRERLVKSRESIEAIKL